MSACCPKTSWLATKSTFICGLSFCARDAGNIAPRLPCTDNGQFPAITLPSCLWASVGRRSEKGASGATLRWALLRSRIVVPWF